MKNIAKIILCALLMLSIMVPMAAFADGMPQQQQSQSSTNETMLPPQLLSLKHNCPNTGRMLPEKFDPNVKSYILTVASWVSRVRFTPTALNPGAVVRVNNEVVLKGGNSSYIKMDDNPKQAIITVTNPSGETEVYTIFIQRRPSEKRTRVSAGYINEIYYKNNEWYIDTDLVTVTYKEGNVSTFENKTPEHYKYACVPECIFYTGTLDNALRAKNIVEFMTRHNAYAANYSSYKPMYRFVYIEDKIVAVLPYAADPVARTTNVSY